MSSFTVTSSDSTPAAFQQQVANHNSTTSSNSSSDSHKGTRPFQVNANAQPWTPQGHLVPPAQQQLPGPARHHGGMGFNGRPQPFLATNQVMSFPAPVTGSIQSPSAGPAAAPKFSLCPTFLEHGFCDGRSCLHAHTFEDLHPIAQSNLLLMLNMSNSQLLSGHYAAQQVTGITATTNGVVGANLHAHLSNPAAYQQALAQQLMEDDSSHGPSARRQPHNLGGRKPDAGLALNKAHLASHTASMGGTSSHNTSYASTGVNAMPCPPSPESHSDISSVSSGSGGRAVDPVQPASGGAAAALQSTVASANLNDSQGSVSLPHSGPESPSSPASAGHAANGTSVISRYGVQPSPFIKSQMYYSQSASKVTLPDRCRYPHATPGTYYDYLNVKRSATKEDICAKYKQWRDEGYRKACALDAEKADAMDRLIVDAKNILSSDTMRAAYDALLPPVGAGLFGAVTSPMKPAANAAIPSTTGSSSSLLKPVVAPSSDSIW